MQRVLTGIMVAALAACSSGDAITPINVSPLTQAQDDAARVDALQSPAIGLRQVNIGPSIGGDGFLVNGSWQLTPRNSEDWHTIGDNAYLLAKALFKVSPGELVINVTRPDHASLTQFRFDVATPYGLKIKAEALSRAIVKIPAAPKDRQAFCDYLAGYAATGNTSPAYQDCPQ